jgi:dienelactone hydrolase
MLLRSLLALSVPMLLTAQQVPESPLDGDRWGVVDSHPAMPSVRKVRDVEYLRDSLGTLTVDLYLPANLPDGSSRPAVLFINGVGDSPGDRVKDWAIYASWPRLLAAQGIIGISMDADRARIPTSLNAVMRWLRESGPSHGIDAERIGIYAASANVRATTELLFGDTPPAGVRAAVLYYGGPPSQALRPDLPVMFVVAEGDHTPARAPGYDSLWQRVTAARAPWSVVFGAGLPHAFDAFDDSEASRRLVRQTIAFWRTHLDILDPPMARSEARNVVAAGYWNNPTRSLEVLTRWTEGHPEDATGWFQLGRARRLTGYPEGADSALDRAAQLGFDPPWFHLVVGQLRMQQRRWADVHTALTRAVNGGIESSLIRGQLGYAALMTQRWSEAAREYERSFALGIPPGRGTWGVAAYNLAIAYGHLGRKDEAFARLEEAVAQGIASRTQYADDTDLAPLRSDSRFAAFLARLGN